MQLFRQKLAVSWRKELDALVGRKPDESSKNANVELSGMYKKCRLYSICLIFLKKCHWYNCNILVT